MTGGRYDGRADGQGRVYQATGDQHIVEQHYHGGDHGWSGTDSVRRPAVARPPVTLRDRTELMERLRGAVAQDTGGQVYVLHGLGGCGKTAVAYAVFEHATSACGRLGLWVNASDPASLRSGMLAVAADRGAGEGELQAARSGLRAAADLVWSYLDASDEPWFLVLDNADEPSVLRDGGWLRTSPRGTVLVTSRQAAPHWWPGAELLHVGVLPRDEAARVLCDLAPEAGTEEDAAEVADRLGRLPLALTLAGGFLSHQVISPWTMAEYGRNLDGDAVQLLDQGAVAAAYASDSRHLVSRTWELSLDALVDQGLPEAVTLLRLLSCWAGDPLPLSLLAGADLGPQLPPHRVESALRGLLDQSLTSLTSGTPRCLRTHGVLLDSVFRGIPDDQLEQLLGTAARLLLGVLPEVPEPGPHDPGLALLVPHAEALLRRAARGTAVGERTAAAAAEGACRLAVALHRTGDYAAALSLAEEGAELAVRRLGADHPWVLRLLVRAARTTYRMGRFADAEERLRGLLADCERALGEEAPEVTECRGRLGLALWQLGRREEGVSLARQAAKDSSGLQGPAHPLSLRYSAALMDICIGTDLEAELAAAPSLLEACRRELGAEHTVTLMAEFSYAYALFATGRPAEAVPRARGAREELVRRYGPEHPLGTASHALLSQALFAAGHHEEAVAHMAEVADARARLLGHDHPWAAEDRERLARFRAEAGEAT